jgi:hypothetical protein
LSIVNPLRQHLIEKITTSALLQISFFSNKKPQLNAEVINAFSGATFCDLLVLSENYSDSGFIAKAHNSPKL